MESSAWCVISRKHPSVTCGASSPERGAYVLKREPIQKSLPFRGGGPAKLVEGFSWNLLRNVLGITEEIPPALRATSLFKGG